MKKLLIAALLVTAATAQTSGTPSGSSSGNASTATAGQQPSAAVPASATAARRNSAATSETFTAAVANDLLFQFTEGMESRNSRRVLAAFDREKLADYGHFSSQVTAWLRDNSSFRVYYKVRQTSLDGARGMATVDFEYEAQPMTEGTSPLRRRRHVRFRFERRAQGRQIGGGGP